MPNSVLIFAAGFGTRMRPLTDKLPKPLLEVAGKALIDHALDLTRGVSDNVVINAHYRADQIQAHIKTNPDLSLSIEDPEILDTGGGLKNALPFLGRDPVFTLNSDAIWRGPNPLQTLAAHWDPVQMDGLLMLVPLHRTVAYTRRGNFRADGEGKLSKDQDGMVYTGAQIIKTDALDDATNGAFSMHYLWDQMLDEGTLYGIRYDGSWADVGTPSGIVEAEAMLNAPNV